MTYIKIRIVCDGENCGHCFESELPLSLILTGWSSVNPGRMPEGWKQNFQGTLCPDCVKASTEKTP